MMKKTLIIVILTLFIGLAPVLADEFSKVGTVGAQFLKIGLGARYIGLGEAATALVDDVYGLYWNPAALATIEKSQVTFTSVDWIDDVRLNYFAIACPWNAGYAFGFAANVLSMGDMEITTVNDPEGTGRTFGANSFALVAGVSKRLTDRFIFGINFKYISEKISEEQAQGFCFDFGTLLYTGFRSLRMGVNISNLGPEMKFDGQELKQPLNLDPERPDRGLVQSQLSADSYDMPLMFRVGLAYDLIDESQSRWTLAAEARDPSDNIGQFSLGSEYCWKNMFSLRAGYKFNYAEEGLALGGGLKIDPTGGTNLSVDYAWADFGRLQSTHRFSITLHF